ncbi:M56 family metallopeptidase [Pedobacter nyackensis]|uniref:BlaR1 peptidase M56 n=1 Tax=Pedobacter nyackensis TaxID=475255 RepID=A0A1W2F785_9SPHI|nr:M56 family metallopeptidase [Pedobacter nyackensis]SMD17780.1 BlaR1 peptidase M56 [Pedobacter nyackensis]
MEAIVNNLIKAIGWGIFHSLWQAAIIYGILLALVSIFPKMTARLKHNLAYGAMCLMFATFTITFFAVFKWPANNEQLVRSSFGDQMTTERHEASLSASISNQTEQLFPYLVAIYAIGILFQLLILGIGYKKLQTLKQSGKSPVPANWQKLFEALRVKLGILRPVVFYLSEQVNVPLVIGYFKPIVLFPVALVAQLDIDEVEAILVHELSHIRRNDYLFNLIKTAIETLMFFNPFIWLSNKYINIEREHACDDLVLKLTGTPLTYAHALLKLEILKDKTTPALSMAAAGKEQHLYQRIKRITDMKTNYMSAKQQIFAITLTIATVISLAWVSPAKTAPAIVKTTISHQEITVQQIQENKINKKQRLKPSKVPGLCQDTTKKKNKFKIVTVDAKGNKKEYNSVKEMPDSLRKEVIKDTFVNMDNFHLDNFQVNLDSVLGKKMLFLKSPEWQANMKSMSEEIKKKFHDVEWKKQQIDIQKQTEEIKKHFNSREWKKQQKEIKDHAMELRLKFDSPEFKENLKKQIEEAKKSAKNVQAYLSSTAFKKKIDEAKALESSNEFKELKKKFDADVEALKHKKLREPDNVPF